MRLKAACLYREDKKKKNKKKNSKYYILGQSYIY